MEDVEITCLDCQALQPTVVLDTRVDEGYDARRIAQDHADATGHRLVVTVYDNSEPARTFNVEPLVEVR